MRISLVTLFFLAAASVACGAPGCTQDAGALNSAGGLQRTGRVSHVGSMGGLGLVLSGGSARMCGGFTYSFEARPEQDTDGDAFDPDNDNDGASDRDELIAGTDPADPSDALRITSIRRTADGVSVSWTAREGRVYRVVRADTPDRKPVVKALVGGALRQQAGPAVVEFLDHDAPERAFYSIEVSR